MVPSIYRDLNPGSFTPRLVSIGPLHHHDEHLKGFEMQKATYMHHLFHKVLRHLGSTPEQLMKACVTRVGHSIDHIKECYIGMKTYPDSKLVKMMNPDAHSSIVPKIEKGQSVVELDRLGVKFRAKTSQNADGHAEWPMAMEIEYEKVLCSDEEAAGVINNICKEVTISENSIIESNRRYWRNTTIVVLINWAYMIVGLRRGYFGNPWSIIALIAGIILFVLTVVVQTVYGVKVA
ncbi:putative UPF0481 protein [Tanacetum coccineum]